MSIFLSTYVNKLDEKGRVVVPKEFRLWLEFRIGVDRYTGFAGFRSHRNEAIDCFTIARMQKLSDDIDVKLDPFAMDRDTIESSVFADAVIVRCDKDGRILLSDKFLKHAGILDSVAFVGRGATFQLWEPSVFEKHQQKARELVGGK